MTLKKIIITGLITASIYSLSYAQQNHTDIADSLSLDQIMQQVISNNPIVKKSETFTKEAESKIGLAKSGYYPTVGASVSFSHMWPVTELSIPSLGSIQFYPENNFKSSLSLHQNLFDFGKTSSAISYAKENKEFANQTLDGNKQQLALQVINNYFALVYLQHAINIKDIEIQNLQSHLDIVTKKKETGSATQFEILSTRVKLFTVQNQKIDIVASHKVQLAVLNSLLGQPANTDHRVKNNLQMKLHEYQNDSLISSALHNRYEVLLGKKKIELANMNLDVVKAQNNPSLILFADGGWKNGYRPDIDNIRTNYLVGLKISAPIFEGTKHKHKKAIAHTAIEASTYEMEITKRNISSEVVESEVNYKKSEKKVGQAKLQLEQARQAYSLAQVSFDTGAITNLELLDASTNVSESELLFIKSEIDYVLNYYMLRASIGENLY